LDNNKNYEFMNFFIKAFVSVFGIGYVRIAPGTFGSLFAVLVWYISINYLNIYFFYAIIIIVFIFSFKAINIYLRNENKDDPSEVVVDEFIGQSLPLIFLLQFNVYEVLLAFSSFRLFDIFKIYPVNKVENIKGANGVIMDDVVAGIYSLIIIMIYKIILFLNA
jgi:phosphatidylglycerophosphatase A